MGRSKRAKNDRPFREEEVEDWIARPVEVQLERLETDLIGVEFDWFVSSPRDPLKVIIDGFDIVEDAFGGEFGLRVWR